MFLPRHSNATTGTRVPVPPRCSLPELYSSVKDFNKERKQSHHSKICSLSLEEAQKHLMKNVDAMFFTGRPVVRQEDSLPVPKQSEAHNVEPMSMADLIHHSLLMGSISPLERLSRSQQRLAKGGIPPPVHIFPYSIMAEASSPSPLANIKKTTQSTKTLGRLFLPSATPEKSVVGHKAMRYLIADPGKQFMDLVDLEWRYFKGLAKWKRTSPEVPFWDKKYDTEKRFVESQRMPGHIFPPLIRKTLSIYPQVNYKKGGKHFLNWNV